MQYYIIIYHILYHILYHIIYHIIYLIIYLIYYRSAEDLINHCSQVSFSLSLSKSHQLDNNSIQDPNHIQNTTNKNAANNDTNHNENNQRKNAINNSARKSDSSTLSSGADTINSTTLIPLARQLAMLPEIYAIIESFIQEGAENDSNIQ